MLGSSTSKQLIREGNAVISTPKVIAEWNQNSYIPVRLCGSLYQYPTSGSNLVTLTTSGPTFVSSYRLANSFSSQSFTVSNVTQTSNTSLFSFSANRSFAYKIVFYVKTNAAIADNIIIKFNESSINNGTTTVLDAGMSKEFSIDTADWSLCEMYYSPTDDLCSTVNVKLCIDTDNLCNVVFSDLTIVQIDRREYLKSNMYKVADTFSGFRPGEGIIDSGDTTKKLSEIVYSDFASKSVLTSFSNTSATRTSNVATLTIGTHKVTPGSYIVVEGIGSGFNGRYMVSAIGATTVSYVNTGTNVSTAITTGTVKYISFPSTVQKRMHASTGNIVYAPDFHNLSYYVDNKSHADEVSGVFAYYDGDISTNKIILKFLNGSLDGYNNSISSFSLYTYYQGTWTEYADPGTINSNGSLALYWNGSGWDTTERSSTVNENTFTLTGTTIISGIAIAVKGLTTTQSNYTVRYLEVSPRLQIDMTNYLISYSSSEETDSGDLPIAIGTATANSSSVKLENIPRVFNGSTFSIFSDTTGISPFTKLINKNVKFKMLYDIVNTNGVVVQQNIKLFTGYVDSWDIDGEEAGVTLFDYGKYLQNQKTIDILMLGTGSNISLRNILINLLEQNGFSDYIIPDSNNMREQIRHFYSDTQKTVWEIVQELLLTYSYLAYFNADGILKITSHKEISGTSTQFVITDREITDNSILYKPNIVNLNTEKYPNPSEVRVRYNTVYEKSDIIASEDDIENLSASFKPGSQIVWTAPSASMLGYAKLSKSLNPTDNIIQLDKSNWKTDRHEAWGAFSGYALLGSEIIKFDGLEYMYVNETDNVIAQTTATALKGATSITVASATGIAANQYINGNGITSGTKIGSGYTSGTTIPITSPTTDAISASSVSFSTGKVRYAIVKSKQEFESLKATVFAQQSNLKSNYKVTLTPTGRLMNVQRGCFGTKSQKHLVKFTGTDITNISNLKVLTQTTALSISQVSPINQALNSALDTDTQTQALRLVGKGTSGVKTIAYFDGIDRNDYNVYQFSFNVPENTGGLSTLFRDESVGIVIGYDPVTGSGIYINIIPEYNGNGSRTSVYRDGELIATSKFSLSTGGSSGYTPSSGSGSLGSSSISAAVKKKNKVKHKKKTKKKKKSKKKTKKKKKR